jgi:hypothetical protein
MYVGLSKSDERNLPGLQVRSARSRIAVSLNSNGYEVVLIRHRQGPLSSFEKNSASFEWHLEIRKLIVQAEIDKCRPPWDAVMKSNYADPVA